MNNTLFSLKNWSDYRNLTHNQNNPGKWTFFRGCCSYQRTTSWCCWSCWHACSRRPRLSWSTTARQRKTPAFVQPLRSKGVSAFSHPIWQRHRTEGSDHNQKHKTIYHSKESKLKLILTYVSSPYTQNCDPLLMLRRKILFLPPQKSFSTFKGVLVIRDFRSANSRGNKLLQGPIAQNSNIS